MKNITYLFIALLGVAAFTSCTIEKRRYMDGYHVEWNHRGKAHNELAQSSKTIEKSVALKDEVVPAEETPATIVTNNESISATLISPSKVETQVPSETREVKTSKSEKIQAHGNFSHRRHTSIGSKIRNQGLHSASISVATESNAGSAIEDILLIILAIFVSPLAVYLHEGSWNTACWINLILWLLFILPGFIHALIVILA